MQLIMHISYGGIDGIVSKADPKAVRVDYVWRKPVDHSLKPLTSDCKAPDGPDPEDIDIHFLDYNWRTGS